MKYRAPTIPRARRIRPGFTLLETMLVLALLVALAAITWPSLKGVFAAETLRKAADQLHADLTRARAAAIRSGQAQQLLIDAASGRYGVEPLADVTDAAASDSAPTPAGDPFAAGLIDSHTLPVGVSLLRIEAFDDVTPAPMAAGFALPQAGTEPGTVSSTVYFHPDGTTSSARFTLANEQGLFLRVELRGLTGTVAVGELLTSEAAP